MEDIFKNRQISVCVYRTPFEVLMGDESKEDEEEFSFYLEDSIFNSFGWNEMLISRTELVILEENEGFSPFNV
jgi:hypothetical protein